MASLDARQVQLRLTNVRYILDELRKKRRLTPDPENPKEEVFNIQFDSRTITFKKDRIVTVGKQIADCLIADAFVIVGAPIDGVVEPVLEVVREFDLSDGEHVQTPTTCLFCKEDQGTAMNLAQHLMDVHGDEDENARGGDSRSHAPARNAKSKKASVGATTSTMAGADPEDDANSD